MIILKAYIGDITCEKHDGAIVNAAKNSLLGGGGVDGAIHQIAGPELLKACSKLPVLHSTDTHDIRCFAGAAIMTDGFDLDVPHIIHTVGPIYKDDSKAAPEVLTSCYNDCMRTALINGLPEITFPAIGTGIYGYPLEAATVIAVKSVLNFTEDDITVNFICFDETNFLVYKRVIDAARNNWVVAQGFR